MTAVAALFALAACHANVEFGNDAKEQGDNVHVAMKGDSDRNHVSLDVPGFSAKFSLPDLAMGEHMDMDGIKLAADTDVTGIDIQGQDDKQGEDHGRVHMTFANPGTPATVIAYYRKAAEDAGYDNVTVTGTGLSATKGTKQFALSVAPKGTGSGGTITMSGGN
jgi:hypothetical protein